MIILVDKMLKMQILDCGVVISWIFSENLRSETDRWEFRSPFAATCVFNIASYSRQWVWEVLNTALERLSRHIHKVAHDVQILRRRVEKRKNDGGDEVGPGSRVDVAGCRVQYRSGSHSLR